MRTVAALYVDPRGPYPSMPGVDCWDESRDAARYDGFDPVVAHPPCGPWGRLRHLSERPQDTRLAPLAVKRVQFNGGVLEHPAHSKLWEHCGLPKPGEPEDSFGGFTVQVNQVDWGHVARKATWVYCVGVPREAIVPPEPKEPTHWISGRRQEASATGPARERGYSGGAAPAGIKICSAQQRRRTPPLFAAWLVWLARQVE